MGNEREERQRESIGITGREVKEREERKGGTGRRRMGRGKEWKEVEERGIDKKNRERRKGKDRKERKGGIGRRQM